jgi:hypothetical protein
MLLVRKGVWKVVESIPVLKRRYRELPPRRAMFVDLSKRIAAGEETSLQRFRADRVVLDDMLLAAGKREIAQIYVIGGWSAASSPSPEWFQPAGGEWERQSYNRHPFLARYKNRYSGRSVTVYGSAQWFGDCADLELVRRAYLRLRQLLRNEFGTAVQLMGTPARTGLDLIERSLPQSKDGVPYEYPLLGASIREKIEHNIGQGRMEMLEIRPDVPETDKLYVLDGVWMYASCCRRLPVEPVTHDTLDQFADYRPVFYKLKYQVPSGWDHIGLLPTWHPRQKRPVWPSKPGNYWFTSYVSGYELRLALEKNWPIKIEERWLFADESDRHADPLENWITKLRKLRDQCTDEKEGEIAPLLRSAFRAITLKAIGSMHRRGRYQQVETPLDQADRIPADAEILWQTGSHVVWRRAIPLDKSMLHFQHSEWSAYVWSHARKREAEEALKHPRAAVIGLRSDAVVLASHPGLGYDPAEKNKPGDFRLKEVLDLHGRPLPKTSREYLDLRLLNRLAEDEEVVIGA